MSRRFASSASTCGSISFRVASCQPRSALKAASSSRARNVRASCGEGNEARQRAVASKRRMALMICGPAARQWGSSDAGWAGPSTGARIRGAHCRHSRELATVASICVLLLSLAAAARAPPRLPGEGPVAPRRRDEARTCPWTVRPGQAHITRRVTRAARSIPTRREPNDTGKGHPTHLCRLCAPEYVVNNALPLPLVLLALLLRVRAGHLDRVRLCRRGRAVAFVRGTRVRVVVDRSTAGAALLRCDQGELVHVAILDLDDHLVARRPRSGERQRRAP